MHINPDHFLETPEGRVWSEGRNARAWEQCFLALPAALKAARPDGGAELHRVIRRSQLLPTYHMPALSLHARFCLSYGCGFSPCVRERALWRGQPQIRREPGVKDLLAAEAQIFDANLPRDVDEVVNYVRAMDYGLERLAALPVSVRLIREIHTELMRGVRGGQLQPGELRRSQNWIGPAGSTLSTATFVPPPHHIVPEALGELEKFLHRDDGLPPLVKIALAHAQFETIHPFLDGNGRVGRLLITFLLTQRGLLNKPVLYLSHYFKQNRQEYYEHLQAVRERGEWEAWVSFFLRGVIQVAGEAAETARRILRLREQHRTAITAQLGRAAGNGHKVLESLYDRPIVSVKDVQGMTGTTYAAANSLVSRLVALGVLSEMTGFARNRRFRYAPYIELFSAEGPTPGATS